MNFAVFDSNVTIHSALISGESSCSPENSHGGVPGLFVVIAAVCITMVCVIGLTANLVTFYVARRNFKRTSNSRVQRRATKRLEAICPFIIDQQTEESNRQTAEETTQHSVLNLTSLEEFFELQYSLQSEVNAEPNTESHRMSWV